jgi:hypothetical protein
MPFVIFDTVSAKKRLDRDYGNSVRLGSIAYAAPLRIAPDDVSTYQSETDYIVAISLKSGRLKLDHLEIVNPIYVIGTVRSVDDDFKRAGEVCKREGNALVTIPSTDPVPMLQAIIKKSAETHTYESEGDKKFRAEVCEYAKRAAAWRKDCPSGVNILAP